MCPPLEQLSAKPTAGLSPRRWVPHRRRTGLWGFAALLFVLTPLFTVFLPVPSFLLPARLLDRHADRITQTSIYPLRSLLLLLKIVAGLCWGVHPEVRARFGLPPLPADPNTWRAS